MRNKDLGREKVLDVAVQHKTRMCEDKSDEEQDLGRAKFFWRTE